MKVLGRTLVALLAVAAAITGLAPVRAAPPPEDTFNSDHFSITWVTDPDHPDAPDLTDRDADGAPDAVEAMVAAFEAARAFELGELGYEEPPGSARYPLHIAEGAGTGYTNELPGGSGRSKPSFIAIPPGLVHSSESHDHMRSFAAHEYMHAIQIGYDSRENIWIREASSSWVEDRFVDEANPAHHLLEAFVLNPRTPLNAVTGDHEYGAFVFLQFLTERFGGGSVEGSSIVRELWEEMAVPEAIPGAPDASSLEAVEAVLARRGVGLDRAWSEFLLWERRLGHYEEGAAYKEALATSKLTRSLRTSRPGAETCRLTSDSVSGEGLPPLSGDYVVLQPPPRTRLRQRARVAVEGPPGTAASYILKPVGGVAREGLLTFSSEGVASLEVRFGRSETRRITVGLGNGSRAGDDSQIAYSLQTEGRSRVTASSPSGAPSTIFGTALSLSGEVTCRGKPAPFADVVVTETENVSGRTDTYDTVTNASGRWSTIVSPDANATFVVTVADPLVSHASSSSSLVGVRVSVTGDPVQSRIPEGSPVIFGGQVEPPHPAAVVSVEFRRPEGQWRLGAEVPMDEAGNYQATFVLPNDGVWELRSRVADTGDQDHLSGGAPGSFVFVEPQAP